MNDIILTISTSSKICANYDINKLYLRIYANLQFIIMYIYIEISMFTYLYVLKEEKTEIFFYFP